MSGLERNNYFTGKLLTEKDFNVEQRYHVEKHKLHNRFLHGCGVVHGLAISLQGYIASVSPGLALDCAGNEIIVLESIDLKLPEKGQVIYVTLSYQECPVDPVLVLTEPVSSSSNNLQYSRIREEFVLAYEFANPWSGHKRENSVWLPYGKIHAIPLGRLKYKKGYWRKSHYFRPPHAK